MAQRERKAFDHRRLPDGRNKPDSYKLSTDLHMRTHMYTYTPLVTTERARGVKSGGAWGRIGLAFSVSFATLCFDTRSHSVALLGLSS